LLGPAPAARLRNCDPRHATAPLPPHPGRHLEAGRTPWSCAWPGGPTHPCCDRPISRRLRVRLKPVPNLVSRNRRSELKSPFPRHDPNPLPPPSQGGVLLFQAAPLEKGQRRRKGAKRPGPPWPPMGVVRPSSCSAALFVPQRPGPCVRLDLFRYPHTAEAAGSIPAAPTRLFPQVGGHVDWP
jgi:hypothetical protein